MKEIIKITFALTISCMIAASAMGLTYMVTATQTWLKIRTRPTRMSRMRRKTGLAMIRQQITGYSIVILTMTV